MYVSLVREEVLADPDRDSNLILATDEEVDAIKDGLRPLPEKEQLFKHVLGNSFSEAFLENKIERSDDPEWQKTIGELRDNFNRIYDDLACNYSTQEVSLVQTFLDKLGHQATMTLTEPEMVEKQLPKKYNIHKQPPPKMAQAKREAAVFLERLRPQRRRQREIFDKICQLRLFESVFKDNAERKDHQYEDKFLEVLEGIRRKLVQGRKATGTRKAAAPLTARSRSPSPVSNLATRIYEMSLADSDLAPMPPPKEEMLYVNLDLVGTNERVREILEKEGIEPYEFSPTELKVFAEIKRTLEERGLDPTKVPQTAIEGLFAAIEEESESDSDEEDDSDEEEEQTPEVKKEEEDSESPDVIVIEEEPHRQEDPKSVVEERPRRAVFAPEPSPTPPPAETMQIDGVSDVIMAQVEQDVEQFMKGAKERPIDLGELGTDRGQFRIPRVGAPDVPKKEEPEPRQRLPTQPPKKPRSPQPSPDHFNGELVRKDARKAPQKKAVKTEALDQPRERSPTPPPKKPRGPQPPTTHFDDELARKDARKIPQKTRGEPMKTKKIPPATKTKPMDPPRTPTPPPKKPTKEAPLLAKIKQEEPDEPALFFQPPVASTFDVEPKKKTRRGRSTSFAEVFHAEAIICTHLAGPGNSAAPVKPQTNNIIMRIVGDTPGSLIKETYDEPREYGDRVDERDRYVTDQWSRWKPTIDAPPGSMNDRRKLKKKNADGKVFSLPSSDIPFPARVLEKLKDPTAKQNSELAGAVNAALNKPNTIRTVIFGDDIIAHLNPGLFEMFKSKCYDEWNQIYDPIFMNYANVVKFCGPNNIMTVLNKLMDVMMDKKTPPPIVCRVVWIISFEFFHVTSHEHNFRTLLQSIFKMSRYMFGPQAYMRWKIRDPSFTHPAARIPKTCLAPVVVVVATIPEFGDFKMRFHAMNTFIRKEVIEYNKNRHHEDDAYFELLDWAKAAEGKKTVADRLACLLQKLKEIGVPSEDICWERPSHEVEEVQEKPTKKTKGRKKRE